MDSRLIAGAYSQHFRALEREQFQDNEKKDSITRAKRLSQETNKRRKFQAQKRKQEAKREERRRQDILTKRREEQKQATEKYQRSHIPSGSLNSARSSPRRGSPRRGSPRRLVPGLDDALNLIRKNVLHDRPQSGRDHLLSFNNENEDPMKRAYFSQTGHHFGRPSSGRSTQPMKYEAKAQLMDYSMKNLTSSKSLFEQQLEQQQSLLLEQQQKSLKEFNDAVQKELDQDLDEKGHDHDHLERDDGELRLSDSCSSIDSLEQSYGSEQKGVKWTNLRGLETLANGHNQNTEAYDSKSNAGPACNNEEFYLNQSPNNQSMNKVDTMQESNHLPLNIDLTPSATFQKPSHNFESNSSEQPANTNKCDGNYFASAEKSLATGHVKPENFTEHTHQESMASYQMPSKQISTDSLVESESSDSSISVVRIPENNQTTINQIENIASGYQSAVFPPHSSVLSNRQPLNYDASKTSCQASGNQNVLQGQTAWDANKTNPHSSSRVKADPIVETYNPRYASAIGLSIWPGQSQVVPNSGQSEMATPLSASSVTKDNTTINNNTNNSNLKSPSIIKNAITASVGPISSIAPSSQFAVAPTIDQRFKSSQADADNPQAATPSLIPSTTLIGNHFNTPKNGCMPVLNQQDLAYPLPQTAFHGHISQSFINPPSQMNVCNNLQAEISQLSQQMIQHNQTAVAYPSQYQNNASRFSSAATHPISNLTQKRGEREHSPLQHTAGAIPVPAVRTMFPVNRPPVPASNMCLNGADKVSKKGLPQEISNAPKNEVGIVEMKEASGVIETSEAKDDGEANKDSQPDLSKPLKGILKQLPPKIPPVGQGAGKVQARDSVELARLQNDKKNARKKSVRFADYHTEENYEEFYESDPPSSGPQLVVKNSYRQMMTRPASAKVVSSTSKVDLSKQSRSSSAGTRRPQFPSSSHTGDMQHTSTIVPDSPSARVNLPFNYTQPLNTSAPINRPKAAAHIIMSSESHSSPKAAAHYTGIQDVQVNNSSAATAHKSHLEARVKTINNNFMSKVPVKTGPKGVSNAMVYHVTSAQNSGVGGAGGVPSSDDSALRDQSVQLAMESPTKQAQPDRSRIRDPGAKRVPLSSTTITRTSIVPASTKINYPLSNGSAPSYSVSNAQGSSAPVFDENGLRIDRTPTDEEITWLWDKVRNCLDKEEDKVAARQSPLNSTEQAGKPAPLLSTKLIDGASLGFNSSGAAGLRPGSGYFYPRAGSANANANASQNKAKPVVQQPGSYLRRYGLLQQRRTNSAPSIPSSVAQARAGSAGFVKYTTVPTSLPSQQQVLQSDMPTPMAFAYRPQDNVSESTAAFVMAERLVKQSLTDSHIGMGMEDAQAKQELHNKAKLSPARAVGPSALSLEEQKLMESLDKLNDRLKSTDQKYPGTIQFHQPFQSHLPGFRGHQGLNDSRRQGMPPPAQPRSQSARIRQQIRQYR